MSLPQGFRLGLGHLRFIYHLRPVNLMSGEAWQSLEDAESIPSAMPVQDAVLLDADLDPVLLPGGDLEVRWGCVPWIALTVR